MYKDGVIGKGVSAIAYTIITMLSLTRPPKSAAGGITQYGVIGMYVMYILS
jgi:hypothetical protein